MRGVCFAVLLCCLIGCAAVPESERQHEEMRYAGEGLDYGVSRPLDERPDGMNLDLTLLDLDAEVAEGMLYIEGHTDISPRAFNNAMGEVAAVNAAYGHGDLLARETIAIEPNKTVRWQWGVDVPYLQDWDGEADWSPVFGSLKNGVSCEFEVQSMKGAHSVIARTAASHLAQPIDSLTTSLGEGLRVQVQLPELSMMERAATESVNPGETAMFQLSRANHHGRERIRLLFVRVVTLDE